MNDLIAKIATVFYGVIIDSLGCSAKKVACHLIDNGLLVIDKGGELVAPEMLDTYSVRWREPRRTSLATGFLTHEEAEEWIKKSRASDKLLESLDLCDFEILGGCSMERPEYQRLERKLS